MSLRDLRRPHLSLVNAYHVRYGLRSGTGIVFAFVTLLAGLIIAQVFIGNLEALRQTIEQEKEIQIETKQLVSEVMESIGRPAVKWALGGDERWAYFLVDQNPALLSAIFLILLFTLPFLVTLGAFNQVSGDVQQKGLRYLLLRTERANIFFGRFLGTYFFCLGVVTLLVLTIGLYCGLKLDLYRFSEIAPLCLRTFFGLALLSLPYVALCSWISAAVASPFGSLLVSQLVVGGLPLLASLAGARWEPAGYLAYALPWGVRFHMLHPDLAVVFVAAGASLLYSAVYLAVGYYVFAKRDL